MATKHDVKVLALSQLVIFVLLLAMACATIYAGYRGRVRLVDAQRLACERGKLDRTSNAEGWRIAEKARRNAGEYRTAVRYQYIAEDLEERAAINCNNKFPEATLIP